jgi:hypothetical protein
VLRRDEGGRARRILMREEIGTAERRSYVHLAARGDDLMRRSHYRGREEVMRADFAYSDGRMNGRVVNEWKVLSMGMYSYLGIG